MDSSKEVRVSFEDDPAPPTLTLSPSHLLTVDDGDFGCGDTVTVSAPTPTRAGSYRLTDWGDDCDGTPITDACVLTMDAPRTASATFVRQYSVTLLPVDGGGGTLSKSPDRSLYDQGADVTVTAEHDHGMRVESWGEDCAGTSKTSSTCVLEMTGSKHAWRVSVTFEDEPACEGEYALSLGAGLTASPSSENGIYDCNTDVDVTAEVPAGKRIASWDGDCSGTSTSSTTCSLVMDAPRSASVTFEPIPRTLTIEISGGSGTVDPDEGTHVYDHGESETIEATPATYWRISGWGGDCSHRGTETTCRLTMNSNKSASVGFERITYTLTTSEGSGGSIVPEPGVHTYNAGATATVTADPDEGKQIASWGGACSGTSREDETCTILMNSNKRASVTFEDEPEEPEPTFELEVSHSAGGYTNPAAGTYTHNENTTTAVVAVPNANYEVDSWSGGSCAGSGTVCWITMNSDKSAHVDFKLVDRALTISHGSNGDTQPAAGTYTHPHGTQVVITADPDTGYQVDSWSGACRGSGLTCIVRLSSNQSAHVTFEPIQRDLTISHSTGGTTSPVRGTHTYDHGTSLTITASPSTNYEVSRWGGACSHRGTETTCEVTMDRNKSATVFFELVDRTLTLSHGSNGDTEPAAGTYAHPHGTSVTITADPDDGYEVAGWSGACTGRALSCTVTMSSDKSVSVTFQETVEYCYLTVNTTNGGNAGGGGNVICGRTLDIWAQADTGYCFDHWGGGIGITGGGSDTCTKREETTVTVPIDLTYTANFER